MAVIPYAPPELSSPLWLGLLALAIFAVLYAASQLLFAVPLPAGVPLIREPPGAKGFSLKTRLAYYIDCEALYREAYDNYGRKGKAVVLPGLGFRKEVILPPSSLRWVLAQPESAVSSYEALLEIDGIEYSCGDKRPVIDGWQGLMVKKDLNSTLETIVNSMNDELKTAFDTRFGTDTENWREIGLQKEIRLILAQAASRFIVGPPLCRNEEYLQLLVGLSDNFIAVAGAVGALPPILKPILGPVLGQTLTQRLIKKNMKFFMPLFRERIEQLEQGQDVHEDLFQMMLRFARKERPNEIREVGILNTRLCVSNFASYHQTAIQTTNMILNILGSDSEFNTVAALREEISQVIGSDSSPTWTKVKVRQLVKADSVARETLRLHNFGGRAIFRKVVADGVVTDGGYALPKGTFFSFLSQPAQTDNITYDAAQHYDPFRFSRTREPSDDTAADADDPQKPSAFVTTSADFLPFGHGKHACPGRFLVDFELKMIIAYLLLNYDMKFPDEYNGKRPENVWKAEAMFPPAEAKIMVKRRSY